MGTGATYQGVTEFFNNDVRVRYAQGGRCSASFGFDRLDDHPYWNFRPYAGHRFVAELKYDLLDRVMIPTASTVPRKFAIVSSVLLLHALALWALQSGLLARAVEVLIPVQVLTASVPVNDPPATKAAVEPPKPMAKTTQPLRTPIKTTPQSVVSTAPVNAASNTPTTAPTLSSGSDAPPSSSAPSGVSAPQVVAQTATSVAKTAERVELPSSDANYLHNPKPEYPRLSRQRNEQGKVVVYVYIAIDGSAQKAEIKVSSGFERLDAAALATVKAWIYVPGKRGGVPEAMWFAVPINFVME